MKFNKVVFAILFLFVLLFQLPSFSVSGWMTLDDSQKSYPQINIAGEKTWFYSNVDIFPSSNYYLFLPSAEARTQSLSWIEKLDLLICAELSSDLDVFYGIKQQPAASETFNVRVGYKDYTLLFGDLNKYIFKNQEFVSPGLFNGVSVGGKWQKWKANYVASAQYAPSSSTSTLSNWIKFRNPEYHNELVPNGYDDDPWLEFWSINLDRYDIDGDSVKLYIDQDELFQDFNFYVIDGLVLFPKVYLDSSSVKIEYKLKNGQKIEKEFNIKEVAQRRAFEVKVLDYSEKVIVDGVKLIRNIDYLVYKNPGLIVLNRSIPEDVEVKIEYDYSSSQAKQSVLGGEIGYKTNNWNELGFSYLSIKPSTLIFNPYTYSVVGLYDNFNLGEYLFLDSSILQSNGQSVMVSATEESGTAIILSAGFKNDKFKLLVNYKDVSPYFASERKVRLNSASKQNEVGLYTEYALNNSFKLFGGISSQTTLESSMNFDSFGIGFEPSQDFLSQIDVRSGRGTSSTNSFSLYQKAEIGKNLFGDVPKKSEVILKYSNNVTAESTISVAEVVWLNKFWSGLMCLLSYRTEINSQSIRTQTPFYRVGYEIGGLGLFYDYSQGQKSGGGVSSDKNEQGMTLLYELSAEEFNPLLSKVTFGMGYKIIKNTDSRTPTNNYEAKQIRFNGGLEF